LSKVNICLADIEVFIIDPDKIWICTERKTKEKWRHRSNQSGRFVWVIDWSIDILFSLHI